jgi:hypothetical protein
MLTKYKINRYIDRQTDRQTDTDGHSSLHLTNLAFLFQAEVLSEGGDGSRLAEALEIEAQMRKLVATGESQKVFTVRLG